MTIPTLLVVAKAPVAGLAKTRIATETGAARAADLAAAALLDTLEVVRAAADERSAPVVVALTGDLSTAARSTELRSALSGLEVVEQRGESFAERLVHAHHDADRGAGVVQIGMDTPHLLVDDLVSALDLVAEGQRAMGPAVDGGWWLLGLPDVAQVDGVATVPMSTEQTAVLTERAVGPCTMLRSVLDMDTWTDARTIAAAAPTTRVGRAVSESESR